MKKFFLFVVLFTVSFSSLCQRSNNDDTKNSLDQLLVSEENTWTGDVAVLSNEYFANLVLDNILYSRYFIPIIENTVKSNRTIFQELYIKGGSALVNNYKNFMQTLRTSNEISGFYSINDIDTTLMFDNKAEVFCAWALFMKKCPVFLELNDIRKNQVFTLIMNTLRQENYRLSNPNNILVMACNSSLNLMQTKNESGIGSRLTQDEVMSCLGNTLVGVVAGSSALIRDFVNVINGTNLGWSGIKSVARSFFGTLVGSNAIGATIGFGVCIVWETFF